MEIKTFVTFVVRNKCKQALKDINKKTLRKI